MCAFSDDAKTLIVVSTDGNYYLAEIPAKGGDCVKKDMKSLVSWIITSMSFLLFYTVKK